jgi:superfamily I DNA and/or RNA helicase
MNGVARFQKKTIEIAVIAGYVKQVRAIELAIRDHLHTWQNLVVVCNTVDAFQGREADACIYSVTRANRVGRLGFLREKPRLNVALSRGRDALVIIGDATFCRLCGGENPFRQILDYIEGNPETCELRDYVPDG